jgi:hypothetical protein
MVSYPIPHKSFIVLRKARKLNLPIEMELELFDTMVVPILLYGAEV